MDRNYLTKIKLEVLGADLIIEDADISLDYIKTDEEKPNYCEITIYNVSDDTYRRINSRANSVRVYVDIDGTGYGLVFAGDLRNLVKWKKAKVAKKKRKKPYKAKLHFNEPPIRREDNDPNIATIISLEDGKKTGYFNNYVSKSYSNAVTNKYVLQDILNYAKSKDSNLKISANINALTEYTYPAGAVFHGSLINILSNICKTGNAYCTMQDDVIVVSSTEQDKKNITYTYLLDGTNCPTPETNTDKELDILAPFIPNLNPFNFVKLNFKDYAGLFQVKKIESKIDNFGENCESNITVKMDI